MRIRLTTGLTHDASVDDRTRIASVTKPVSCGSDAKAHSLLADGNEERVLPAGFFVPGRSLMVTACGHYTTRTEANVAVWLRVLLGGHVVANGDAWYPPGGASSQSWRLDAVMTCYRDGPDGELMVQGWLQYVDADNGLRCLPMTRTEPVTVDTTIDLPIDIQVDVENADSEFTLTCTNAIFTKA